MAGKTSVAWEGNKPTVTFPIPGVPNAIAGATLERKFMAETVVVKNGANTYEFDYSDYRDWNNPLNPAEAFYAGKMTEKQNGTVTRDITTTLTETGTDVCRGAGSGKHQGGDQANQSACQLDSECRQTVCAGNVGSGNRRNPAAGRRTSGHDRKLEWRRLRWVNMGVKEAADVVQRR